jgi:hypothetical protein
MGLAGAHSSYGTLPVWRGAARSETITSSGTAASGSLEAAKGEVAKVFCDTAVYASTQGTASATNGIYVAAGVAEFIACTTGDTISVIDV